MRLRVRKRSGTRELSNPAYKKRPGNLMTMPSFAISLRIRSARIDRNNCWALITHCIFIYQCDARPS
jgi:hypothetical protein